MQREAPANRLLAGVALRLQGRIARDYNVRPALSNVTEAVRRRQELLSRTLNVRLAVTGASASGSLNWPVSLQQHPLWIGFQVAGEDLSFDVSDAAVASHLAARLPLDLPPVVDATVLSRAKDSYGVERVTTTGTPRAGYALLDPASGRNIAEALRKNRAGVEVPMEYRTGTLTMLHEGKHIVLNRLSGGMSDFRTSPWGRKANIKKGTEQHLHNVLIPEKETFSFNATLGGPVTLSRGWYDSLIIVNGSELEPAPGGGICQVATTAYRAALLAGLPIVKRAPHSLYVHYYELFGLGLDATIFPGKQDLTFENDTPGDIVVQASLHGTELLVEFYGISDGRTVALDGPHFSAQHSPDLPRELRSNEIGWIRRVYGADGAVLAAEPIISAYGKMPRSLGARVLAADEATRASLHAAAPAEPLAW